MFGPQRAFIEHRAAPKRSACCSRRAGKTQGIIRGMLERCVERPRSVAVYFTTSLARAKKMVWDCADGIPMLISDLRIDAICEPNESEHRVSFKNGSVLWVTGCETMPDARKWKGLRYDIAVLDEAQDWTEEILGYMINEALAPALMDRRGELLVTGTPGPVLAGLFFEITNGRRPGWELHGYDPVTISNNWTCNQNPHIDDAEAYIRADAAARGLSLDDPIIQREYRGLWVRDVTSLLFQYLPGRNDYVSLPFAPEWSHVLGMDVGVRDLATFVLMSYQRHDRTVYIQDVHGESGADVTRFAQIIAGFQQKYGRGVGLVMDTGALALGYALELQNRHGLNIKPAKKTEKAGYIRLMNDQLRLGFIKVHPAAAKPLVDQWQRLQIDPATQIEKKASACDYADAALYGWRDCWSFLATPAEDMSPDAVRTRHVEAVIDARMRAAQGGDSLSRERRAMAQRERFLGPGNDMPAVDD